METIHPSGVWLESIGSSLHRSIHGDRLVVGMHEQSGEVPFEDQPTNWMEEYSKPDSYRCKERVKMKSNRNAQNQSTNEGMDSNCF